MVVQAYFFGGCSLEKNGFPVEGAINQRQRLAMLALLAAHTRGELGRDRLVGLLWPEQEEATARRLLSESLYVIRKSVPDCILSVGDRLRLDPARIWTDVQAFSEAVQTKDWATAAQLYAGPFLDGVDLACTSEMSWWIDRQRQKFGLEFARAAQHVAQEAEAEGRLFEAAEWRERLWWEDPMSVPAALELMRILVAAGRFTEATAIAKYHAAYLAEMGMDPDPRVMEFRQKLTSGETPSGTPASARVGMPDDEEGERPGMWERPVPADRGSSAPPPASPPPKEARHEPSGLGGGMSGGEPTAREPSPLTSRWLWAVAMLLVVVGIVSIFERPASEVRLAEVVIFPLFTSGDVESSVARGIRSHLRESAMADLGIRVPDAALVDILWSGTGGEFVEREADIADALGARAYVNGSIRCVNDLVYVRLEIWRTQVSDSPLHVVRFQADCDDVAELRARSRAALDTLVTMYHRSVSGDA